jgi:cell division protein ZapA (FtsZ GTPase activity inhibitor)
MEGFKKLKIAVFGKNYCIATDENEQDVSQAVKIVDALMKAISNKTHLQDDSKIAVLAALQLANDLSKSQQLLDLWQTRAQSLDNLLANEVNQE